jgi:aminocarboxymuconate-semialdehyde decarboxylase
MLPPIVDSHHHFLPRAIVDDLAAFLPAGFSVRPDGDRVHVYEGNARHLTVDPAYLCDIERQLLDMDAAGVRTAILSAAVFQEWMSMDAARIFNRELGEIQSRYGDRFIGLAHVPPFGEDGALDELERAVREYGLRGVCITTSFRHKYPDEPEYAPFYTKVNELGIPVFVHAAGCPLDMPSLDRFALGSTLGRGLDHALVTARLLYSGVIEAFPNVRFLMGHLGGSFYGMVKRLVTEAPSRPGNGIPARDYAAQLRRVWFDTAPSFWQGPPEIAHAIATLGIDRICFGSDYPAGPGKAVMTDAVDNITALNLDDAALRRICCANASELFRL